MTITFKTPDKNDYNYAQTEYNRVFKEEIERGGLLREKLRQVYVEQGIWSDEKEREYKATHRQISEKELAITKGGIPLSEAKKLAIECAELRIKFESLIEKRQFFDTECVESKAENQRYIALMTRCVEKDGKVVWGSVEAYEKDQAEEWAIEAVDAYGNHIYGLDPNFRMQNPEMKFLVKYKFADEKGRLINKDGHLITTDGKLIDEEGRYVAYAEDGKQYFVDVDGNTLLDIKDNAPDFSPFLDDEGNPIEEEKKKPARRQKAKTTTT